MDNRPERCDHYGSVTSVDPVQPPQARDAPRTFAASNVVDTTEALG